MEDGFTSAEGNGLTREIAEERLVRRYIETRNFYLGYVPEI